MIQNLNMHGKLLHVDDKMLRFVNCFKFES